MFELTVRAHLPVRGIIDECKIGQAQVLNKGETPQAYAVRLRHHGHNRQAESLLVS